MKVSVGKWVTFNNRQDATWFRVEAVDGFFISVRQGDGYAPQSADTSMIMRIRNEKPKGA